MTLKAWLTASTRNVGSRMKIPSEVASNPLAPGGYVAPGAYHALGLAVDVPVHGASIVLHPDPVALLMADPVFNAIGRAVLEVTDQRLAHPAQIIRMHPGSEVAEHGDLALL